MKTLYLIVLFSFFLFPGLSYAEIDIDMSGSNVEVQNPSTLRVRDLKVIGFPGRYWVDLQWNDQTLSFVPIAGQAEEQSADLSGTWRGPCSSNISTDTTITLTIAQSGAAFSGAYTWPDGSTGIIAGEVKDSAVNFYLSQLNTACLGTFLGTGIITGDSISFSYSGTSTCKGSYSGTGTITKLPPPACIYSYSDWGACQSDGTRTRTLLSTAPSGCKGTPVLSETCNNQNNGPTPCTYTYSAWSNCQSDYTMTRTVLSSSPAGCTGSPKVRAACVYTPPQPPPVNYNIGGYVQKGPFINGSSISIYELQSDLKPTGRSFNSQIKDNSGNFKINNISFSSSYVELKADGYYYNEILGDTSSSQLTLYSLSDVTVKDTININLLSHLERDRVEYLLEQGEIFSAAKKQAQKEILQIFSISKDNMSSSETLDISSDGDDNAILLAVSIILHGYRTTAELSELLANISTDIRTDGVLDSASLGTQLINDAKLLNLSAIRTNLVNRYNTLGLTATIPNFEKYVNQFISTTGYTFTKNIQYPQNGIYGPNILFGTENITIPATIPATINNPGSYYDLAADLPLGTSLKIKLILDKGPVWNLSESNNWGITYWNNVDQTFTAIQSGKSCGARLYLFQGLSFTVQYFENNSTTPTRTKTITVI